MTINENKQCQGQNQEISQMADRLWWKRMRKEIGNRRGDSTN